MKVKAKRSPESTVVCLRVKKEMHDEFFKVASERAQTPSLLIRQWIANYIGSNKVSK